MRAKVIHNLTNPNLGWGGREGGESQKHATHSGRTWENCAVKVFFFFCQERTFMNLKNLREIWAIVALKKK